MNPATASTDPSCPTGPEPGAAPEPSPGDPKATPAPAADKSGGMIGEGEANGADVERVESDTGIRRDGGMIGEG